MLHSRVLLVFILTTCFSLRAQDSCGALLQHGIYDKLVEIGSASSRSQAEEGICRAYHSYRSDSTHADANGNYYEVIKGNVSYSGAQIKNLGEEMCEHHGNGSAEDRYAHLDQRTVSPAALQAWQECTRNNLLATTTSWQDTDQGTVGMDISFHLAGGGNDATVKAIRAENLKCSFPDVGRLVNAGGQPVKLGLQSYTLHCSRPVQTTPFQSGTRKVYSEVARLTVDTSVGAITRDLPAILPAPQSSPVPFGTIVAWYSLSGPVPTGWKICDGTDGTPDLRDRFIRGTGQYSDQGKRAGGDPISIPSINLFTSQPDLGRGMRMDNGNGIINHHSLGNGLVDSFTEPVAVTSPPPAYISLIYIIKQ